MNKGDEAVSANGMKSNFGIAEWYGELYRSMEDARRKELLVADENRKCPFLKGSEDLAPKGVARCSKAGGVCSIRSFSEHDDGEVALGPITATCPIRFLESRIVIEEVGALLLNSGKPIVVKEVPFLRRDENQDSEGKAKRGGVGKIDLVLLHPEKEPKEWCAVEMQAVYFSGGKMDLDFAVIRNHSGNRIPMPGGNRRPDFRSSGPKRLMPQLQIKVPTLRRWGKKMVVIVDNTFINSMSYMPNVGHMSNADIIWAVVSFNGDADVDGPRISLDRFIFTTLEDSVSGLTAGRPASLSEFEAQLLKKSKRLE